MDFGLELAQIITTFIQALLTAVLSFLEALFAGLVDGLI